MKRVMRSDLEACAAEYDAAVARDPAVDPFCSRSAWLLSYHDAFDFDRPLWVARQGDDWVWLAEKRVGFRSIRLEPLENMWGLGCPLVGRGAAALLADHLAARRIPVLLLGLPLDRDRLAPLARALEVGWRARTLEPTTRFVASLAGGIEGWAARRTPRFRRNLRANLRRVEEAGVRFRRIECEASNALRDVYQRVLEIEGQSHKALAGRGADSEPMRSFYEGAWTRLAARGELLLLFAELGERAVGYLHGALVEGRFRGLQFSFVDEARRLGLGNALQYEMLRWLCEIGAHHYDLGSHSDYKRRWAEPGLTTFGLFLHPVSEGRDEAS